MIFFPFKFFELWNLLVVSVFAVICEFLYIFIKLCLGQAHQLTTWENLLNDYLGGRECKLSEVRSKDFFISRF